VAICSGCASQSAGPGSSAATTTINGVATPATAHNAGHGLTVTMAAVRGSAAHSVTFTITASASHAPGALHYVVAYGDGTTAANVTPQFCRAGPGRPAHHTWRLTHTYPGVGPYPVTAQIGVTCSTHVLGATQRVTP
jgi:hypothetical protein